MNDVINQIAISAERDSRSNFLWGMSKFSQLLTPDEKRSEDLSSERIHELDQSIRAMGHFPPPRLKLDEAV